MSPLEKLLAIEEIKQVRARYFRGFDNRDLELFGGLFTADARWVMEDTEGVVTRDLGRDELLSWLQADQDDHVIGQTFHYGFMPDIEIIDARNASAVWAMSDHIRRPKVQYVGFGYYYETYRKEEDGAWRISSLRLKKVRVDPLPPIDPDDQATLVAILGGRPVQRS